MLKRLYNVDAVYTWLEEAFPISEIRPKDEMQQLVDNQQAQLIGYMKKDKLVAIMFVWINDAYFFVENFAVHKRYRKQNIGSQMLQKIVHKYCSRSIVLEVEEAYDKTSQLRMQFYRKNGFIESGYSYLQPQINVEVNAIPLHIMSNDPSLIDAMKQLKTFLFHKVYQDKI